MDRQYDQVRSGAVADDAHLTLDRKLAGIDLNLLVTLDALLVCRNVTHAARRIGQTQPSVSRALARLRDLLGDDLLVRSSTGFKLTARGEYLAGIVPAAMSHLRDVISSRQHRNAGIRISVDAHLMPALVSHFLHKTARENEPLKVSTHKSPEEGLGQLRSRMVQLMLGAAAETSADIRWEPVFTEDFVTLVGFEYHKLGGARPSLEAFLELTHIDLVENGKSIFPEFAELLIGHGVQRTRLFEVPDLTSAALMVSQSGLALTIPRSIAGWLTKTLPLSVVFPPIAVPAHEVAMYWLADAEDSEWRRLIDDLAIAARDAVAHDQASIRALRSIPREE